MVLLLSFKDVHGENVELTFGENRHGIPARHVLVVLKHEGKWLLTEHSVRGIEFPGGKAEEGENIEEAAKREVMEETGVTLKVLRYVAEYVVQSKSPFCKAVFTGEIAHIEVNPQLHETKGAVWMTDEELLACENLSFYMKDAGMTAIKAWVQTYES